MMRTAKKWITVALLAGLMQITIYCDERAWEDFFNSFEIRIYDDYRDCGRGRYYWSDCGGESWWFDFGWW